MIDLATWLTLATAAFGAGMLNAVAGGGTFLTLPALLFAGLPPICANTTSAAVVLPGYASAAWGFRHVLRDIHIRVLIVLILTIVLGSVIGARLLLGTSDEVFQSLAPWLILFATGLFAFGPKLRTLFEKSGGGTTVGYVGLTLVSAYGGYFNGGLGIALLSVLNLSGTRDLNVANGLKSLLSFVLTMVSVVTFAYAGSVNWQIAGFMMLLCTFGGYLGSRLALVIPTQYLRAFIVVLGLSMTATLLAF